jgi:hypothetical protein
VTYHCTCRHKMTLTLDEAYELAEVKANLEWMPVLPLEAKADPMVGLVKALLEREPNQITINPAIHVPAQAAPVVQNDVHLPETRVINEVTLPASQIDVHVPEQAAPVVNVEAKATMPAEIVITSLPDRLKRATRDKDGEIIGMVETDG